MGEGVFGGKDFLEKISFSLEWKSESVMEDDSGDDEGDEGEEDWLRQGCHSLSVCLDLYCILICLREE